MKIKLILAAASCLIITGCISLTAQQSEIRKGDGAVYECSGQGSCYKIR